MANTKESERILEQLVGQDWVDVAVIAEVLGIKRRRVIYFCNVLKRMDLVEKQISKRKAFFRLTEEGKKVLEEKEKRTKKSKTTSEVEG